MGMFLKHCLTGIDNSTYDLGKVLWGIVVIVGLALETASFYTGKPFDLQTYGVGAGVLLGAGSGAIWMKLKGEPAAQDGAQ